MTTVAIVLIGGRGSRFSSTELDPKPLIKVLGHTQLFWAAKGAHLSYYPDNFIFACRTDLLGLVRDEVGTFEFLSDFEVLDVGSDTDGPAHTVELALEKTHLQLLDSNLVIIDNDCFNLIDGGLKDMKYPFVSTTTSNNPAHCFLELSATNSILALYEKQLKGNIVVSGNYGFLSPAQFLEGLHLTRQNLVCRQELFMSSVIDQLIRVADVHAVQVSEYFSLGTPAEILNLDSKLSRFE